MSCAGKKIISLLQGVYEPLVVNVNFDGDLQNPPAGTYYDIWLEVNGPNGQFQITDCTVLDSDSIRFEADTREGGEFHTPGLYQLAVWISQKLESDHSEIQRWGSETNSCVYIYALGDSPTPSEPVVHSKYNAVWGEPVKIKYKAHIIGTPIAFEIPFYGISKTPFTDENGDWSVVLSGDETISMQPGIIDCRWTIELPNGQQVYVADDLYLHYPITQEDINLVRWRTLGLAFSPSKLEPGGKLTIRVNSPFRYVPYLNVRLMRNFRDTIYEELNAECVGHKEFQISVPEDIEPRRTYYVIAWFEVGDKVFESRPTPIPGPMPSWLDDLEQTVE